MPSPTGSTCGPGKFTFSKDWLSHSSPASQAASYFIGSFCLEHVVAPSHGSQPQESTYSERSLTVTHQAALLAHSTEKLAAGGKDVL